MFIITTRHKKYYDYNDKTIWNNWIFKISSVPRTKEHRVFTYNRRSGTFFKEKVRPMVDQAWNGRLLENFDTTTRNFGSA